jgi:hypothetical protein
MIYITKINDRLYLFNICLIAIVIMANIGCARTMQAHIIPDKELSTQATRIYVFRPSIIGLIENTTIFENNIITGQIGPRGYIVWDTKPGDITLQGGLKRGLDFVKIIAQPGKTYYFKLRPTLSMAKGYSLIKISENEGKKYLAKLKQPEVKVVS